MTMPVTSLYVNTNKLDAAVIDSVVIRYGRRRPSELVPPAVCTFRILADNPLTELLLGADVLVESTAAAVDYTRFTGRIVSIRTGKYTVDVECTSAGLGRLARWPVSDYVFDYGVLTPGQEIAQLFDVNGITSGADPVAFTYDPGQSQVIGGYRLPGGTALDVAQQMSTYDVAGILWEKQDGTVVYSDSTGRDYPSTPWGTLTLQTNAAFGPPCILDDWTAEQTLSDMVNSAVVTYGGTGRTVTLRDQTSIDTYGIYSAYEDLPVSSVSWAQLRASRLVANYRQPAITVSPLTIELSIPSAPIAPALSATVSTAVDWLPGPPPIPEMPDVCYLEGYTETITQTSHRLELWLSDIRLSRTPQTWGEVSPTLKWNAVTPATRTWYELIGVNL